MVLSYDSVSGNSDRPPFCRCGNRHFHVHSYYWRKIARKLIKRFICLACRHTVSMIPNSCVPYKHHPVSVINPTLDDMMLNDRSGKNHNPAMPPDIHPSTAYRWCREFSQFSSVLATEGAKQLGIKPITGTAHNIYQTLKTHFSGLQNRFFTAFQVILCRQPPPIGVFRSFTF